MFSLVTIFTVFCFLLIEAGGFIATLKLTGSPFVIPPIIPPLLFVYVLMFSSSSKYISSFASEPSIPAIANPAPNSSPLTAGIEYIIEASSLSTELKNGSPTPAGIPITEISTTPPTESPSSFTALILFSRGTLISLFRKGRNSCLRLSKTSGFLSLFSNPLSSVSKILFICAPI